ncbi:hypothetical protein D3C85_1735060 [compost metagenome]
MLSAKLGQALRVIDRLVFCKLLVVAQMPSTLLLGRRFKPLQVNRGRLTVMGEIQRLGSGWTFNFDGCLLAAFPCSGALLVAFGCG